MALIDSKTMKNADKCKDFMEATVKLMNKIDKNSVLSEEMEATVRSVAKIAPYKKDFEKVYGMTPYDYYMKVEKK